MRREIKFRAWDKFKKEFLNSDVVGIDIFFTTIKTPLQN